MKKTRLYGIVNAFLVNYDIVSVDDVLDTHKCLMKKHTKIAKNNEKNYHEKCLLNY